jgi:pyochelin biosynthetic protein PchC
VTQWLRQFAPARPGATRLICFPHAGGAASYFLPLARTLSPEISVLGVQYPGRHDRRAEPVPTDLRVLAAAVAAAVAALPPGPVAFLGHSMGALVAFEAAVVVGANRPPDLLLVSGARAPALPPLDHEVLDSDASVIAEVLSLGGTAPELLADAGLRELILPAVRADYRALLAYAHRPGVVLGCPLTAMVGASDPGVSVAQSEQWRDCTTGRFESRVFPGGHFYLDADLTAVAAAIRTELSTSV